ncbi:MAG: tetratricopeptide repeat protein [Planctomycetota bacterium]
MDRRPVAIAILLLGVLASAGCNLQANRRNTIGRQAFEQGQYAVAINEFQQALNSNPQNADAYYNLAASFSAFGKQTKNRQWQDQAEQLYRQAISIDDQHADAHRGLAALLIETQRESFAFDLLNQWKTRYPAATEPLVELARLYQEYGDARRATDLLADALRINPGDLRSLKAMGHLRELEGQTHLALDNYLRALQVNGNQPDLQQRVASLQTQLASRPVPSNLPGTPNQPAIRYGAVDPFRR